MLGKRFIDNLVDSVESMITVAMKTVSIHYIKLHESQWIVH